jgi:UDP-glucose 4-epimerase
MKVLVTGCAGFIGSHLCERLISENMEVVGVDSLNEYYDARIKRSNLLSLIKSKSFTFHHEDLLSADITRLLKSVDYVFHLAAQPGVRGSWGENFSLYVENNILATQRLLEAAKGIPGIQKFVYASSSSVYGQIGSEKVSEDHPALPHSPYGATKLAGEHLCALYRENYGVPVVSLRLFSVYGPRQRPDMAFTRLIYAGLTHRSFPLYGDGLQERDFTFVLDVVQALVSSAERRDASGIFNVGGGNVLSMQKVTALVEAILGSPIHIQSKQAERGDVRRTSADITKSKMVLAYSPQYEIEHGLREHVEYMKGHLDLYHASLRDPQ